MLMKRESRRTEKKSRKRRRNFMTISFWGVEDRESIKKTLNHPAFPAIGIF
jgi:hypothetical protein